MDWSLNPLSGSWAEQVTAAKQQAWLAVRPGSLPLQDIPDLVALSAHLDLARCLVMSEAGTG